MGNTKLVYFEGVTKVVPSEAEVLHETHGTYCTIKAHHRGDYMRTDEKADAFFVTGSVHSYSTVGPAEALARLFTEGVHVVVADLDWADVRYTSWRAGKAAGRTIFEPTKVEDAPETFAIGRPEA